MSRAIAATQVGERQLVEKILHTGQHFDAAMSDQFFVELGIPQPAFTWALVAVAMGKYGQDVGGDRTGAAGRAA